MNATRIVLLVARRELIERVRSPMFIGMLVIIVLIIGAVVLLPAVFTDNTRNVGLVDPPSSTMEQLITGEAERAGLTVAVTTYPDVPAAEAALAAGKADAVIVAGHEVVWEAEAHPQVETVVMSALFATAVEERAATLDLDATAAAGLLAPPELTVRSLETVDPDIEARRTMAMVAMVLLFMAIAMYGAFVLTGVVEEKSSRVVEVLLARVSPRHLLAGKILGIGALGLVQVVVIAVAAAVALRVSDWGDVELPPVSPALVLWLVVWFVLGFAFYSTAYGALGA
ncbi:MAG TPA: ABC transporter permease, partial [Jiangellaceae bacterium]|nr:ABC transporter permease [Jiangellaceae bacterium]